METRFLARDAGALSLPGTRGALKANGRLQAATELSSDAQRLRQHPNAVAGAHAENARSLLIITPGHSIGVRQQGTLQSAGVAGHLVRDRPVATARTGDSARSISNLKARGHPPKLHCARRRGMWCTRKMSRSGVLMQGGERPRIQSAPPRLG